MEKNKKIVVIYESKYGFTQRYAHWISQELSCPVIERAAFHPQDFSLYDVIVYGGGLYAGGVSGIKSLTKNWNLLQHKQVILFTCGLANPKNPDNVSNILHALSKILSPQMLEHLKIFHLRGGIDYSRLSFVHKSMMAMLRKMLLKKDPCDLSDEDQGLLDTYGTSVDFTDRGSIMPLIQYVSNL